jgi:RimJ/RimL family protein N-acetyltransferase
MYLAALCRKPVAADASRLAEVITSAWQEGFRGLVPQAFLDGMDPARSRAQWERDLHPDRRGPPNFLVVEQDASVVGFSVFGPSRDSDAGSEVGEIYALHAHPQSWGRGASSRLFEETVLTLERSGFTQATLWVMDGNHRARKFYEKHGMRHDGAEQTHDRIANTEIRELRYRIALPDNKTAGA